jgi:hypothetical protein
MSSRPALPKALAPWEKQLSIFPPEIGVALGTLAARLTLVLDGGGFRQAPEGEPDGFGGIARRGSYERLALSEWLLQEELPEEFIRRVVSGEHTFLERAHHTTSAAGRLLVLFDAGPEQLGGPRVVHLALLIALAQRAERRKATTAWGILQDPPTVSSEAVTVSNVRALLRGRSTRHPSQADLDRWNVASRALSPSESWLVGSERLAAMASDQRTSVVTVSEVLEPGAREQSVVQVRAGGAYRRREVVLQLPPGRVAVQLLRDPFATSVVPRSGSSTRIDRTSNILFSVDGRRLYVRGEGGALLSFYIPNSARATTTPVRVFSIPQERRVLAVGQLRQKKKTVVVSRDRDELILEVLSKRDNVAVSRHRYTLPEGYDPAPNAALVPLGVISATHVCFIDSEGNLVELYDGKLSVGDADAASCSKAVWKGLSYVVTRPHPPYVMTARAEHSQEIEIVRSGISLDSPSLKFELFFGSGSGVDLIAYRRSSTSWTIVHGGEALKFSLDRACSCVGVIERGYPSKAHLVALDETRTKILLVGQNTIETIASATTPITFAAASDANRDIAWFTEDGQLGVYSVATGATTLRMDCGVSS